jgi:hypothetical protein
MSIKTVFKFDFGQLNDFYYNLLCEEDFDFKTKKIDFNIKNDNNLEVEISCQSVLELKIANNALIKSLETIGKTLSI